MTRPVLEQALAWHVRRYPLMQPVDALKLLYQSEFGGGHLAEDPERCLRELWVEYAGISQKTELPLTEPLEGDLVRINLGALEAHGLSPRQVFEAFLYSADQVRGRMERFGEKIQLLCRLTSEGQLPFGRKALDDRLFSYAAEGFPPCAHSETYRMAYRPSYRVLLRSSLNPGIGR